MAQTSDVAITDVAPLVDRESYSNECDKVNFNPENKRSNLNKSSHCSFDSESGVGNIDASSSSKSSAKESMVETP